jgi:hypothetical protein
MKFKCGDYARCLVDHSPNFTRNRIYVVSDTMQVPGAPKEYINRVRIFADDTGRSNGWIENYFDYAGECTKIEKIVYGL